MQRLVADVAVNATVAASDSASDTAETMAAVYR
jgi:hypothetical protein